MKDEERNKKTKTKQTNKSNQQEMKIRKTKRNVQRE
jgi:hypothetical protein